MKELSIEVVGKMRSKRARVTIETGLTADGKTVFVVSGKSGKPLKKLELANAVGDLYENLEMP